MRYGFSSGAAHVDVEVDARGRVVAVWYQCVALPFKQHDVGTARAADMGASYRQYPPRPVEALELGEAPQGDAPKGPDPAPMGPDKALTVSERFREWLWTRRGNEHRPGCAGLALAPHCDRCGWCEYDGQCRLCWTR